MNVVNPYRFGGGGGGWVPPSADLWYHGSDGSSGVWIDQLGNQDATIQGGAAPTADGVICDVSNFAYLPYSYFNSSFGGSTKLSGAFWVKNSASSGDFGIFANGDGWTSGVNGIYASMSPDRAKLDINNIAQYYAEGVGLWDGSWVHVAFVFDSTASRAEVYINNVKTSVDFAAATVGTNTSNFKMGQRCDQIDDCILSLSAWAESDIDDIYNNSPGSHV